MAIGMEQSREGLVLRFRQGVVELLEPVVRNRRNFFRFRSHSCFQSFASFSSKTYHLRAFAGTRAELTYDHSQPAARITATAPAAINSVRRDTVTCRG